MNNDGLSLLLFKIYINKNRPVYIRHLGAYLCLLEILDIKKPSAPIYIGTEGFLKVFSGKLFYNNFLN